MKPTRLDSSRTNKLTAGMALSAFLFLATPMFADETTAPAADAINAFGIDLLHQTAKPDANALLSPYSIQSALAMTYAGADGATRAEMAKVLHYPANDAQLHGAFAALRQALDDVAQKSARDVEQQKQWGATHDPITLTVANRLFGQAGYQFRDPFLALVKDSYNAPLEQLDYIRDAAGATKHINGWVEDRTRKRIQNLIPDGALDKLTRMVLVNAIYLKAPWADEFRESATKLLPFHLTDGKTAEVPTMTGKRGIGYARRDGLSLVTLPYRGGDLQFLILLPEQADGLAALEKTLTPALLATGATLPEQEAILYLPKFKLEPPAMSLGDALQPLGMKSAFDVPKGSANFDRLAPRTSGDYLIISKVFHKTFLNLDEQGTEAAAATAVAVQVGGAAPQRPKPIEVRVDRPFVFAIQHRQSGACLFLGHVTDPR